MLAVIAIASGSIPAYAGLSDEQQQQILEAARHAYDGGVAALRTDPVVAAALFDDAARRPSYLDSQ